MRFGLAIARQNWRRNSSGQMALNTWNYIVFTYDGATEKFYLNGVLDSATVRLPPEDSARLRYR